MAPENRKPLNQAGILDMAPQLRWPGCGKATAQEGKAMSTESLIIKAIVITVLFMLITLTPKAHATEVHIAPVAVTTEGTSHAPSL
jgi:hypothetical protein